MQKARTATAIARSRTRSQLSKSVEVDRVDLFSLKSPATDVVIKMPAFYETIEAYFSNSLR